MYYKNTQSELIENGINYLWYMDGSWIYRNKDGQTDSMTN